jgi:hypothetical protein
MLEKNEAVDAQQRKPCYPDESFCLKRYNKEQQIKQDKYIEQGAAASKPIRTWSQPRQNIEQEQQTSRQASTNLVVG